MNIRLQLRCQTCNTSSFKMISKIYKILCVFRLHGMPSMFYLRDDVYCTRGCGKLMHVAVPRSLRVASKV